MPTQALSRKFSSARSRCSCREDAVLEKAAVEHDLRVSRSLERLEDHFLHTGGLPRAEDLPEVTKAFARQEMGLTQQALHLERRAVVQKA
jgi:hypothetical protein